MPVRANSCGIDVILTESLRTGGLSTVKAKLQTIVASASNALTPMASHVLFNWRNPVINCENTPIVTMRLGQAQYTDSVYGRKIKSTQCGQFVIYPFSLHVWNSKLNYEMQDGVDESRPTTDLAEKIVNVLEQFPNDSEDSGICYFYNVSGRESEHERGPRNINRVVVEGFMMVKRPL